MTTWFKVWCSGCGQAFPSYVERVPGVRPGTTRNGPGRGLCGACLPNDHGIDWKAALAGRRVVSDGDE